MLNRFTLQNNLKHAPRSKAHLPLRPQVFWGRCEVLWNRFSGVGFLTGLELFGAGYKDTTVGGDWNHGILNDFPIILGIMILTDELIFFRGVETTNQDI
jgi:hypothetical protein